MARTKKPVKKPDIEIAKEIVDMISDSCKKLGVKPETLMKVMLATLDSIIKGRSKK